VIRFGMGTSGFQVACDYMPLSVDVIEAFLKNCCSKVIPLFIAFIYVLFSYLASSSVAIMYISIWPKDRCCMISNLERSGRD
jgi:hypothetical protein